MICLIFEVFGIITKVDKLVLLLIQDSYELLDVNFLKDFVLSHLFLQLIQSSSLILLEIL